jgi:ABC-2 type transport system permease protein
MITFGLVCIGLTVASFMESLESFGVIQSFMNLPLFFLSGALFPIREDIPSWLQIAASVNPLTCGVDALRTVILGSAWQPLRARLRCDNDSHWNPSLQQEKIVKRVFWDPNVR